MANGEACEERLCRVCFTGAEEDEGQQLISPCRCQGSQKYVHVACLRRWQCSVQLSGSNHPEERVNENRHTVCNVCRSPFDLPPQDRGAMMADLAGVRAEQVAPGMLLVTKRTRVEDGAAASAAQLNLAIRAFLASKAAHFREAVYILTEVVRRIPGGGSSGDTIIGVNLSRPLEGAIDVARLDGGIPEAELQAHARRGIHVCWMNGGPLEPRTVSSMLCVKRLPQARREEFYARHGVHELVSGTASVVWGSMSGVMAVAAEEAQCPLPEGSPDRGIAVLAWAGFAQWSRMQLLGELARGSWGWCFGDTSDVVETVSTRQGTLNSSVWEDLRYSSRLSWAPQNELSRDFESRTAAATSVARGVQLTPDRPVATTRGGSADARRGGTTRRADEEARAVAALVRQFEALRRRGSSREPRGGGTGGGAAQRARSPSRGLGDPGNSGERCQACAVQ